MVVSDPVDPTMAALSCPISMPDFRMAPIRAGVISLISRPVLKLTSID
jgi:hypothetical protein